MPNPMISQNMDRILEMLKPVNNFIDDPVFAGRADDPLACDFALGNPQEMPLPGYVEALQRSIIPQDKDWFAYKLSEPESQAVVAESLRAWRGVRFDPDDIFMTNGAFAGLAVTLKLILDPGDEVIFVSPPWFFYESLIASTGGVPVRVSIDPQTFDLDIGAIEAAITPRTRAIIVNSPNNPTGKVYPAETLEGLAQVLTSARENTGRPISIISDESYSRIVFDGRPYISPSALLSRILSSSTHTGKPCLPPASASAGSRFRRRCLTASPCAMPLRMAQFLTGFAFPNALLQHALPDLDRLSIDIPHLQRKRDRMVPALQQMGYQVHSPEGHSTCCRSRLPRTIWALRPPG